MGEEGVEEAFELLHELPDRVRTGQWVGDCFIYTNNAQRLNYYVGGQVRAWVDGRGGKGGRERRGGEGVGGFLVLTLCHTIHPINPLPPIDHDLPTISSPPPPTHI